jgi:hypothetical protein
VVAEYDAYRSVVAVTEILEAMAFIVEIIPPR